VANPDATDPYWAVSPMLPAGKYVVEVVVPPGYELVKEEDKNILIGDNYIAPVTQQFGGLGAIFIVPDQAAVGASYNPNNAQNPTQDLGTLHLPRGEGDTGSVEIFWPCVGASRIVPNYNQPVPAIPVKLAPFAGATRNLCDRKEVTLQDQMSALAKFWVFQLDARRRPLHRRDHGRLHFGIRSVSRRSSARNFRRPTCRYRSKIGLVPKYPACIQTNGVPTTA